jgi:hypothetical protein
VLRIAKVLNLGALVLVCIYIYIYIYIYISQECV